MRGAMSNESHGESPIERIVLAFGDAVPQGNVVTVAAALARGLEVSLAAVLVEDERLLRLADFPAAREIGFTSACLRPLGREEMERAWRAQARRARRLIGRVADSFALSWSMEVVRGNLLRAALERSAPGEPVVLWRGTRLAPATEWEMSAARTAGTSGTVAVAVLPNAGPAGERALRAAQVIAQVTGGAPVLRVQDRVAIDTDALNTRGERIAEITAQAVTRQLRTERVGLVVVAREALADSVIEACERLGCPICVVA